MAVNANDYIQHHLKHWQWSPVGDTSSFWTFNLDTILISVVCGLAFFFTFHYCVRQAKAENPGKLQVAVEAVVGFVDGQVQTALNQHDSNVSSLALSIFMWIWLMNFMDLIPVDLIPFVASHLGVAYFRAVPTADLSLPLAIGLSVFCMIVFESIRAHSLKGFLYDVLAHPFSIYFFPANILFRVVEEVTKPVSLSLRLFGNMFAGELVFFLIALTPFWMQWFFGWIWLGLHLFIISLQAFIFMTLTIAYLGMARTSH
ncbi:F0F1 ATP synthase subunit A [Candidatus Synchoanobacter obligatus]|uniref:ATP synthase subunit a n=1 Tax=Candidatus Synchoanobacter obligatus TaxID=2919597 RepID=A0ABT1L4U2_9GAMM|nr:F0F1 ATP synthase subunit A [Candidatus Synchoanobacter obligatus]MCP8352181.1 F0F1 ATP synthase subunit A [Candidatus Synchoanobacter obligatus]